MHPVVEIYKYVTEFWSAKWTGGVVYSGYEVWDPDRRETEKRETEERETEKRETEKWETEMQ